MKKEDKLFSGILKEIQVHLCANSCIYNTPL